jgi:hypothetical protein
MYKKNLTDSLLTKLHIPLLAHSNIPVNIFALEERVVYTVLLNTEGMDSSSGLDSFASLLETARQ